MKKYKLKKELPGTPMGTIYEKDEYGFLANNSKAVWLHYFSPKEPWFHDWFEEVEEVSSPFGTKLNYRSLVEPKKKIKLAPALESIWNTYESDKPIGYKVSQDLFVSEEDAKDALHVRFVCWPAPPIDKEGYLEVEDV